MTVVLLVGCAPANSPTATACRDLVAVMQSHDDLRAALQSYLDSTGGAAGELMNARIWNSFDALADDLEDVYVGPRAEDGD